MTLLLVVRHGESTWNAARRWQGRADPPLSDRGVDQARRAVGPARRAGPFDVVATSSLERARRTGEILAAGLGVELLAPVDELSERDAGEWQGLTRDEIEQRDPGHLGAGKRPPGYEDDGSVVARATAALVALADRGASTLVVAHGGVVHALESAHEAGVGWRRLDNLAGRRFEVGADVAVPVGERISLIGDGGPPAPPTEAGYV
ncbi:histidine phosphatase family protein [Ilumatobacter sp.]|uniref:histidine phosphatase family protein n=1 Tax=Ilumatobacter sp. TaxID=1967498 RepID=UPI003B518163